MPPMHSRFASPALLPSVLDRLLDDHPHDAQDRQSHYALRQHKQAVARDLETLLNTRCIDLDGLIESLTHTRNSMLSYGIPDLSSLGLVNPDDRALLRDRISESIARHEPRLTDVRVSLDSPEGAERLLHFRVDAVLRAIPNRPPVVFDALLQLSTNQYQVKDKS